MQNKLIYLNRLLLLIAFIIFYADNITSQVENTPKDVDVLTTIVRLYVNAPKVKFLENIIANSDDDKAIDKAQKTLMKHQVDRKAYIRNILSSFESNFDYSTVYFMPDNFTKDLYNGKKIGIFVNTQGEIDDAIELTTDRFLIIGRGSRDDDFLILNNEGMPYGSPFPLRIKQSFITRLKGLFSNDCSESVNRLNKILHRYESKL